jgi:hypothetical protein
MGVTVARFFGRTTTVLAGIRADRTTAITFPGTQGAQWLMDGGGSLRQVSRASSAYRCGGSAG